MKAFIVSFGCGWVRNHSGEEPRVTFLVICEGGGQDAFDLAFAYYRRLTRNEYRFAGNRWSVSEIGPVPVESRSTNFVSQLIGYEHEGY